MGNDQKIDEILSIVRAEQQLNNQRYAELTSGMQEERQLNNQRFTQVVSSMSDLRNEVKSFNVEIKDELNRVYTSLSEDIQAFAGDLDKVKKRVDKLERKIA